MKKLKLKTQILTTFLALLFLTGCYEFNFINQPYQADTNSFFDVEIGVNINWGTTDSVDTYFGVLLPLGWATTDSIEYFNSTSNETGYIVQSDSLSSKMTIFDPPPENYFWWVGYEDSTSMQSDDTLTFTIRVFTDGQTGKFFLDYMLGDNQNRGGFTQMSGYNGMNFHRSNDHLIIVGDPVGCEPEGITFTSQEEVDSFSVNYPNCTATAGNITISGSNIHDLSSLEVLTSIGGNLNIDYNTTLTDLTGFYNLNSISGSLIIQNNPILTSLSGLNNLATIGRSLWIENNQNLTHIEDLAGLDNIGEDFAIRGNVNLTNLNGLDLVTSLGGCLRIESNNSLTSLSGLENLAYIGSGLFLNSNENLTSLLILENLSCAIGWNLFITRNSLTNLDGLNNITSVGGSMNIHGNYQLTNILGLENITFIGENVRFGIGGPAHTLIGNPQLTSLSGLENLVSIGGNTYLGILHSLIDFDGLNNLTTIGGELLIHYNNAMTSLTGLGNLNFLGGNLEIAANELLDDMTALQSLSAINGNLYIGSNDFLTDLTGLESITNIEGNLSIRSNDTLINLTGLNNLESINGDLEIDVNDHLSSLSGLENLMSIDGDLIVGQNYSYSGNPSLTSLVGLENIDAGSISNLYIQKNTSLSTCEVLSICQYLSSPGGNIVIQQNATGCYNQQQVEEACDLHCFPDGIIFTSQQEIDDFKINFPFCTELEGDVTILGDDISNLNGLDFITSIWGKLEIKFNGSLTNLSGLDNLETIEGNLNIYGNNVLDSLSGLGELKTIGGNLLIGHYWGYGNPALTSLSGLDNLTTIGGYLWILDNETLSSLNGLENLTSIDGDLIIGSESAGGNPSLTTLDALVNLDPNSIENLYIYYNDSLSDCDANSICLYINDSTNFVEIHDNASDCNSLLEVKADCLEVSVNELSALESFTVSPNPLESSSVIKYTIPYKSPVTIKIFDLTGHEIKTLIDQIQQQGEQQIIFNTGDLPTGIYFCVLKTNEGIRTRKIIKL